MTPIRTAIAQSLRTTFADISVAIDAHRASACLTARFAIDCYDETHRRQDMRALLDGAAVSGSMVRLGFIKVGGEVRYMAALPCIGADQTNQFYTVKDVELSMAGGRSVFRRVNLDTIIAAQVEFHAANAR